jgi:hypothetical protein
VFVSVIVDGELVGDCDKGETAVVVKAQGVEAGLGVGLG